MNKKDQKNKNILITSIHAAVLCALAASAQAGDTIVVSRPPLVARTYTDVLEPLNGPVERGTTELRDLPDLMPIGFETWFTGEE
jgi:hypothetical protein